MCSVVLSLLEQFPWVWSFCSGLHSLQSGVNGAGACSSPNGHWQNPELYCRTEALDSWRLPSLFVASRNGFRVFCVVTFVTQCGIQTFHCGVKTSLAAASSAGRGAPLINRMAGAAAGLTTSGRRAAILG